MADLLPTPVPEVVMDLTGIYWRRYPDGRGDWLYGMLPVSDNADPVIGPLAVFRRVGTEGHDGVLATEFPAWDAYVEHVRAVHLDGRPHSDTACPRGLRQVCPFAMAATTELAEYGNEEGDGNG